MSLNVPAGQHKELIRNWVAECQNGTGSHAACQYPRVAHQKVQSTRLLRRIIQITIDKASSGILFRLQILQNPDEAAFDAPYATVSHHDCSSQQYQSLTAELADDVAVRRTVERLPFRLQQAVKATAASSVSYLWDPTLCLHDEGDDYRGGTGSAEIYSGAVFNIAYFADPKKMTRISVNRSQATKMLFPS